MLRPCLTLFAVFTLITGVAYPAAVTAIGQLAFPREARGNPELIGQPFGTPRYFWSRPSATANSPYNGGASGGSNLGPANPALAEAVKARIAALRAADPGNTAPVPVDLVTASGSGLDPHISPEGAYYQVGRVARSRGLDEARVRALVDTGIEGRTFGLLGEPRVNVLRLNHALDLLKS